MKIKQHFAQAFSLIELSIVVLIIGILIAGVTQGSRLVKQSKLKTAQNLTSNSPVSSISGLVLWLESTSGQSFANGIEDGDIVTVWNDLNPQSTGKNNAIQTTADRYPIYRSGLYNSMPGILFDGIDDWLSVTHNNDLNPKTGGYSVFFVSKILSSNTGFFYLTKGNGNSTTEGYSYSSRQLRFYTSDATGGASPNIFPATLPENLPKIATLTFSGNQARFYKNAIEQTPAVSYTGSIDSSSNLTIGARAGGTLSGNMEVYEIIIFNRLLKNTELTDINNYLSKKWGIALS